MLIFKTVNFHNPHIRLILFCLLFFSTLLVKTECFLSNVFSEHQVFQQEPRVLLLNKWVGPNEELSIDTTCKILSEAKMGVSERAGTFMNIDDFIGAASNQINKQDMGLRWSYIGLRQNSDNKSKSLKTNLF